MSIVTTNSSLPHVAHPTGPKRPAVDDPSLYINRELSQLHFNVRVLEQAKDPDTPLLERLRFLTISSSNLDEFFEIRVAGLKQRAAHGSQKGAADGLSPTEALEEIATQAHALVREQYRVLNEILLPAMASQSIHLLRRDSWTDPQRAWLRRHFEEQVLPVLTPVGLDPAHPFPRILNKALHFAVRVEGEDAFGRAAGLAIVPVPRCLPRLIALPEALTEGGNDFVMLSSVIHAHVGRLFPGMKVGGVHQFRVTRNADLWVDEEEVEDLLDALRGELPSRKFSDAVRLEVVDSCPEGTARLLLRQVGLENVDLYRVDGPVNLHRLGELVGAVERPELKYPTLVSGNPGRRPHGTSIFELLDEGDLLLHHPFESFSPVLDLLQEAATDPDVLAIKMTLYRTGHKSVIEQALCDAAQAGKEVTVVVEIRARFDEATNIEMARRLQHAGAHVVYGIVGYKAHAKLLMVVRREGGALRRYCHLGTGNYHTGTVRQYTDFGLMTTDPAICKDVHEVLMQLTSVGQASPLTRLLQSPFTLGRTLLELIETEAEAARAGEPSRIQARMNAVSDPAVISALYEASRAGVPIDLLIRGVCCLRPGVPGVSDTITVRSIVGRFLEHSRAWRFGVGDRERVVLASADWMPRNLYRRVEIGFPVDDPVARERVITEGLQVYLDDDTSAWSLHPDGAWLRVKPGEEPREAQKQLLEQLAGAGSSLR